MRRKKKEEEKVINITTPNLSYPLMFAIDGKVPLLKPALPPPLIMTPPLLSPVRSLKEVIPRLVFLPVRLSAWPTTHSSPLPT